MYQRYRTLDHPEWVMVGDPEPPQPFPVAAEPTGMDVFRKYSPRRTEQHLVIELP